MKTYPGIVLLVLAIIAVGCGKEPASSAANAPSGYAGALVKGHDTAVKVIDVTTLNQDIQLFNAQEGRNPKDLDELVTQKYIPQIPEPPQGMKFVYDASQGKVSLAPQ
jgi:hypothetical protein